MPQPPTIKPVIDPASGREVQHMDVNRFNLKLWLRNKRAHMLRELNRIVARCRLEMRKNPDLYIDAEHVEPSIDIRLVIFKDGGSFAGHFAIGTVGHDEAHGDHCAAGLVTLDSESLGLLNELINQIIEE